MKTDPPPKSFITPWLSLIPGKFYYVQSRVVSETTSSHEEFWTKKFEPLLFHRDGHCTVIDPTMPMFFVGINPNALTAMFLLGEEIVGCPYTNIVAKEAGDGS